MLRHVLNTEKNRDILLTSSVSSAGGTYCTFTNTYKQIDLFQTGISLFLESHKSVTKNTVAQYLYTVSDADTVALYFSTVSGDSQAILPCMFAVRTDIVHHRNNIHIFVNTNSCCEELTL